MAIGGLASLGLWRPWPLRFFRPGVPLLSEFAQRERVASLRSTKTGLIVYLSAKVSDAGTKVLAETLPNALIDR